MIKENEITGPGGDALVWILDGDCLYDIPVLPEYVPMFTDYDEILDVSEEYPDHDGITVRFVKGTDEIDLQTSDYFGSVLLSNPQVESLFKYPYGKYVQSPYAQFDGEKFIITNRDVTKMLAWHPKNPHAPADYFDNFKE